MIDVDNPIAERLAAVRAVMLDVDGTLVVPVGPGGAGGDLMPRADEVIRRLRECGIQVVVYTHEGRSIGLVVEPNRQPDELDAFEWYCFECGTLVHRIEVKVTHLVRDLPPLYEAFFADERARTCRKCGALHPGKKPPAGWAKIPQ